MRRLVLLLFVKQLTQEIGIADSLMIEVTPEIVENYSKRMFEKSQGGCTGDRGLIVTILDFSNTL